MTITATAGDEGKLFGSIGTHDIADALVAQGFKVEKAQVRLPNGPLKTTGDHAVVVSLHTGVAVDVNVSVQGETV